EGPFRPGSGCTVLPLGRFGDRRVREGPSRGVARLQRRAAGGRSRDPQRGRSRAAGVAV
ncbi:MAG: hypothetical protein AVDCRST_MAG73-353, partial [uncultured Thermomicrobiales bacterium]